jgi:Alr-MurF fusion protein
MSFFISHIARSIGAKASIIQDIQIEHLLFDSRKAFDPSRSLFFALKGSRRNGHDFIPELYRKGVRCFVVSEETEREEIPDANILQVNNCLQALQTLAAVHRAQFQFPVIGITGSNGKTIVKEWLCQLLQQDYRIVRSPKSYNSQIGVPVSIWEMNRKNNLGIFEAGISQRGEMEKLRDMIQPTIGILTNIGEAHNEGFLHADEKASEKIKLFDRAELVIYCSDDWLAEKAMVLKQKSGMHRFRIFSWGRMQQSTLQVLQVKKEMTETQIIARYKNAELSINIPFTDDASVHNAITCWCVMLFLGIPYPLVAKRMNLLQPVNMRLELKRGINHCTLINDSYSADLGSLNIALNFLQHQAGWAKKTVILSDFFQSGLSDEELYHRIAKELVRHNIDHVIGIGMNIAAHLKFEDGISDYKIRSEFYPSTQDFLNRFRISDFRDEAILVKGARLFHFEQIVQVLEQKAHQTELEINLNALAHNLDQYHKLLLPSTKLMAMVKAFAYGSGGAEIANKLQFLNIDYLGVAYADEGVELRKAGISLRMMVMNTEVNSFDVLVNNNLEPVIFSISLLKKMNAFLFREGIKNYPIHLEIETGMNRLGFSAEDVGELVKELKATDSFRVQSVFSHLAASEDAAQDEFTRQQFEIFCKTSEHLKAELGYHFLSHIANSAAILRHPHMQLDMVRLGIGLYGVDSAASGKLNLLPVATLRSTIAQVKHLKKGDTVGYNRRGVLNKDSVIATVSIGYADGFSRRLGNGAGYMLVKSQRVPVVGAVCMDMTMIDVRGIPDVMPGDEVIVFGKELTVQQLAAWAGTIPYEMMTGISQRVKRVYFEE